MNASEAIVLMLANGAGKSTLVKVLYLPPYSPGLDPIEMALSKVKAHFKGSVPGALIRCSMH